MLIIEARRSILSISLVRRNGFSYGLSIFALQELFGLFNADSISSSMAEVCALRPLRTVPKKSARRAPSERRMSWNPIHPRYLVTVDTVRLEACTAACAPLMLDSNVPVRGTAWVRSGAFVRQPYTGQPRDGVRSGGGRSGVAIRDGCAHKCMSRLVIRAPEAGTRDLWPCRARRAQCESVLHMDFAKCGGRCGGHWGLFQ